jgi:hypothetical protein
MGREEKVILTPFLRLKIDSWIDILFEKQYFGFKADSKNYVDNIYNFIDTIPRQNHRRTLNSRFGQWYTVYKVKNKRTQYFITFDKVEDRYLIKNIITSHEPDYPKYIKGRSKP